MKVMVLAALIASASATLGHAQQGAPDGEWPTYGGDAGSTKYAPLDQIDADNVEQLRWCADGCRRMDRSFLRTTWIPLLSRLRRSWSMAFYTSEPR